MRIKKPTGIISFFIILGIFSTWKLLFDPGIIGHNWDWGIPQLIEQSNLMSEKSFFVWNSINFGQYHPLLVSLTGYFFLFGKFGVLLSGTLLSKCLIIVTIVISGITMFLLMDTVIKVHSNQLNLHISNYSALFAGTFYSLSPFLFNEFIGGAVTQFLTYSLCPLCLLLLYKLHLTHKINYCIALALILSILQISLQCFVLITALLFLHVILLNNRIALLRDLMKSYLIFSILNCYWIILGFFSNGSLLGINYVRSTFSMTTITSGAPLLFDAIVSLGYVRDFFKLVLIANGQYLVFIFYMILIIVLLSLFFITNIDKNTLLFWESLFLISLIFSTGGNGPFASGVLWLYETFPIMLLFRSPQHFLLLTTFSIAILFGFGIFSLLSKIFITHKKWAIYGSISIFLLLFVGLSPFFSGDLGYTILSKNGPGNYVGTYSIAPDYQWVNNYFLNQPDFFHILLLPMTGSPEYINTTYQDSGQGGDPYVYYFVKPFVASELGTSNPPFLDQLKKEFYKDHTNTNISKFLALVNVQYLLLRKDVIPNFGDYVEDWDVNHTKEFIHQINSLSLIYDGSQLMLWKINSSNSYIYPATKLISINGSISDLIAASASETFNINNTGLIFSSETHSVNFERILNNKSTKISNSPPTAVKMKNFENRYDDISQQLSTEISFDKNVTLLSVNQINPTKTTIMFRANDPFTLIFSDSYNSQWKLYPENDNHYPLQIPSELKEFELNQTNNNMQFTPGDVTYLFARALPEENHFLVNGYANAWYIVPSQLPKDVNGNIYITLYFRPQILFYLGLIISGISLIICICYLIFDRIRVQWKIKVK